MKLVATLLSFTIEKDKLLGAIVGRGFSKPTKDDPRARKTYDRCTAEVERIIGEEVDRVNVVIRGKDVEATVFGQLDVINDFTEAGVFAGFPSIQT